jgi:hypothetical protein
MACGFGWLMTDRREEARQSWDGVDADRPSVPSLTPDRERVILLECRMEQLRSQLQGARAEADHARARLAEATAREADHARRASLVHQELADARAELAALHQRLERSEALRAELEGHLFESGAEGDTRELVRLRREIFQERHRAIVNERALARLRGRVEELLSSREILLTRVAEWQQLVREDGPEAADLSSYLSELRREILDLEHRSSAGESREAALRERLALAGFDPDDERARSGGTVALDPPPDPDPEVEPFSESRGTDQTGLGVEEGPVVLPGIDEPEWAASVPADPGAAQPVPEEPGAHETVARKPLAEEPVGEEPLGEEPVAEKPVGEEPVAEKPVAEEPTVQEPAVDPPAAEDTVATPVTEDPEDALAEPAIAEGAGRAEGADSGKPAPASPDLTAPPEEPEAPRQPDLPATTPQTATPPADNGSDSLVAALATADLPALRSELLRRVGRSGQRDLGDAVRPWTEASDPPVRAAAYEALGRLLERDPAALEPDLRSGLADPDARVRRRVVLAAATARGLPLRSLLDPLSEDPDPQVRRVVREVLRHVPPAEAGAEPRPDRNRLDLTVSGSVP